MSTYLLNTAKLIPAEVREELIKGRIIEQAVNFQENPFMEYIFDVYEEFIDRTGEHDDWTCFKCREAVLKKMRELQPYIIQLNNEQ